VLAVSGPLLGQAQPSRGGVNRPPCRACPSCCQGVQPLNRWLALITLAVLWWTRADQRLDPPRCSPSSWHRPLPWWPSRGWSLRRIGVNPQRSCPQLQLLPPSLPNVLSCADHPPLLGMLVRSTCLLTPVWFPTASPAAKTQVRHRAGGSGASPRSWPGLCGALPGSGATTAHGWSTSKAAAPHTPPVGILRALILAPDDPWPLRPGLADSTGRAWPANRLQRWDRHRDWGLPAPGCPSSRPRVSPDHYLVVRSLVLVDLMVAVGVGIFPGPFITIAQENSMQHAAVKSSPHG